MGNNIFQRAKEAVSNLVGKHEEHEHQHQNNPQHEQLSAQSNDFNNEDISVAENIISSAMADSSDAERQQLAELQEELDQTKNNSQQDL
ncbi:DUF3813 domain-containing protein [Fictibacillus enclensis]|uniref:DUF3813 domain-containing protein n=1 Tax=Fictibacillus enclensis TaxID=1017270 RepID=UPI0024C00238|nr:DUF3813 domain-containing protein [Fictibacillus enclensis]MDM5337789.1 DUF3813 domain-containing protein [Fictibacillus enclensis]WHY74152.1 DUF3813 domain-containing protein [Fictibacillus enclensis]